ncbi:hypothetical protein EIP86_000532 [Pleurotus ostreatoroseus]|nr:hypothetical protein EIP86_000532 [Pleurotus ostreatoroseus]
MLLSVVTVVLATQLWAVHGILLPFRRLIEPRSAVTTSTVFADAGDPYNFDVVDFNGDGQIIYVANVTVDGQSYEVQLDTGSSDFWLNTQNYTLSSNVTDTDLNATISYGDTTVASGDIILAPVQFGNYSVSNQAIINAPGSNATSENDLGLLGLSSYVISSVYNTLSNGTSFNGLPLLFNIFNLNTTAPSYITFLLSRSNLGITDGGIFTISEVDPSWSAVQNQSKIAIAQGLGQWVGVMDAVIVNGKNYTGHGLLSRKDVNTTVLGPNFEGIDKSKTLSLFDTGTSLGYMPKYYFDAIYSDIKGSTKLDGADGIYSIPCDTKLNVSMVFNGTEYPINPLDLTRLISVDNETLCINAFGSMDLNDQGMDFILGDSFLRNAYTLFDYGNWTNNTDSAPFVQLLSTTNQSDAWAQFDDLNNARIAQWNSLNGTYNPQ